jgi:hypothetical protein
MSSLKCGKMSEVWKRRSSVLKSVVVKLQSVHGSILECSSSSLATNDFSHSNSDFASFSERKDHAFLSKLFSIPASLVISRSLHRQSSLRSDQRSPKQYTESM